MEGESGELCGIPGGMDETITKGEFNRLVQTVRYYHLRPMRDEMKELKGMIIAQNRITQEHIATDMEFHAKLAGARWALYAIAAILAPVVPLLYYLIKALSESGVL